MGGIQGLTQENKRSSLLLLHDLILTTLLTFTPASVLEPDSAFHLLKPVVLKLGEFPWGRHRATAVNDLGENMESVSADRSC